VATKKTETFSSEGEDMGQWAQVALGEASSLYEKGIFYSDNNGTTSPATWWSPHHWSFSRHD